MSVENTTINPEELLSHAAWLQRLAARLCESTSAAEDLVQDTFVAALKSPPEADRSPRPWLAQVLRNLVRNRARGAGRWAARAGRVAAESAGSLPSPEQLLTQHEAQRLVAELVSRLEEPLRSTVLLCYGQGLSPSEVAGKQGIPAGTVRWRLKRGLDDLRAALDARYGNDRRAWGLALAPLAAGAVRVGAGAVPFAGAMKGLAAVATAAALGLWLGTWNASAPTAEATLDADGQARAALAPSAPARSNVGIVRPAGGGPAGQGPAGDPSRLLAAAAPAAPGGAAPPAAGAPSGPSEEVLQRVMAVGNAPVKGDPKAPVTIVTFSEFQCPFCARVQPALTELLAAFPKEVRLVWKNLPLKFHEHAALAAEAALAANEQGKFWEMHDRLFANQDALDPPALEQHAQAIGLDLPRFRQALESKKFMAAVEADMQLAKEAGLNGTPSFYINGKPLMGAMPFPAFKNAVDDALATVKGLPVPERPQGVPGRPGAPQVIPPPSPEMIARAAQPGNSPSKGDPKAPVTIVVFNDYESPFCGPLAATLDELLALYPKDVRLVAKNLPLAFHPNAALAAEAALAAHEQGKFWEMHQRLLQHPDIPNAHSSTALEEHAKTVGLDLARFRKALEERRFRKVIEEEIRAAESAGIRGTPTALFNQAMVSGAQPLARLKQVVERELARARGLPVPAEPVGPVAARPPPGERPRMDISPFDWPPPQVALPDELLGERLRVPFPTGDAPATGPGKAAVEVLYFNDYDCMGCGRGKPLVDGLRATYGKNLRIVARPVPMAPSPGRSTNGQLVAEAAWAAHAQGKFWEMHEKLFSLDLERNRATLERYAGEIGLDLEDFRAALESGRYRAKVEEDVELLKQAGLRDRPSFVVNGRRADGRIALVQLVEAGLKKAGIKPPPWPQPPAGKPRVPVSDGMMMGLSPPQRFHLENRDAVWAEAVEKQLAPQIESDLRALELGNVTARLECRSGQCRVRVRSPKDKGVVGATFVRQVYGGIFQLVSGPESHVYLLLRDGRAPAVATESIARLRSRRTGVLFSLRTGRVKPEADFPLAKLPRQ